MLHKKILTQNLSKVIPHKMINFTIKSTHYPVNLISSDQIPNFFTLPIALILIAFSYNCIVIVVMFYLFYYSHMLNIWQFVCHCQAANPGSSIVCRFYPFFWHTEVFLDCVTYDSSANTRQARPVPSVSDCFCQHYFSKLNCISISTTISSP